MLLIYLSQPHAGHPPRGPQTPFDVHMSKPGSGPQARKGRMIVRGTERFGGMETGQWLGIFPQGGKTSLGTAPRCMVDLAGLANPHLFLCTYVCTLQLLQLRVGEMG